MSHSISRRDALKLTALAGGAAPLLLATSGEAKAEINLPREAREAPNLTTYHYGGNVLFRWNNVVVATYRSCPLQKYPYFSNLAGPVSGLPLTTESSMPFPHHRGLWLGCEPLNSGDYWLDSSIDTGQIRSTSLLVCKGTSRAADLVQKCSWVRKGESTPFEDERCIRFQVVSNKIHLIDFDIILTAQEDISIKRAKHSFFAVRSAPDIAPDGGGTLINSEGDKGEDATYKKPAKWCGFYGRRANRPDVVEGIAVMNHPENPWDSCPWFTRNYGHLSPSPFGFLDKPWELAKGKSIRLRYRVVLHADAPTEAGLDQIYKDWITS